MHTEVKKVNTKILKQIALKTLAHIGGLALVYICALSKNSFICIIAEIKMSQHIFTELA